MHFFIWLQKAKTSSWQTGRVHQHCAGIRLHHSLGPFLRAGQSQKPKLPLSTNPEFFYSVPSRKRSLEMTWDRRTNAIPGPPQGQRVSWNLRFLFSRDLTPKSAQHTPKAPSSQAGAIQSMLEIPPKRHALNEILRIISKGKPHEIRLEYQDDIPTTIKAREG